ncbi:para-nitrobenzyl esterase-like isoform X2 [Argonauta hians]
MGTSILIKHAIFSVCFIIFSEVVPGEISEQVITVEHGSLIGGFNNETNVTTFLGIPYAKAPTQNLRFELPQPYFWNITRNATKFSPICVQDISYMNTWKSYLENQIMSEDCLYLNIYIPGNLSQANTSMQPIMVWIHGGNFLTGSASLFDGTKLATRIDAIIVTLNYRLGPFGFLSTGNEALPGNMGLHDQIMALKWIKENGNHFGGDIHNMTVFGSESVYLLSLNSSITIGLFNRAIVQNGLWRDYPIPYPMFSKLTHGTCPHDHSNKHDTHVDVNRKQIICLKKLTTEYFLNFTKNYPMEMFSPSIDNILLKKSLLSSIPNHHVHFVFGITHYKTSIFKTLLTNTRSQLETTINQKFTNISDQAIISQYLKYDNRMENVYINAYNGYLIYSTLALAEKTSKFGYTYLYSNSDVFYGDEFRILFGANTTTAEDEVTDIMAKSWTYFVLEGVPQLPNNIKWPVYESTNKSYVELSLNITEDNVKSRLKESDWIFWNNLIPNLAKISAHPSATTNPPMKRTTMHHMNMGSDKIAWGMEDQMVHDLLMGLLVASIFLFAICVTLIVILYKLRTLKIKHHRPTNGIPYNSSAKLNEGYVSDTINSGGTPIKIDPESVTKF